MKPILEFLVNNHVTTQKEVKPHNILADARYPHKGYYAKFKTAKHKYIGVIADKGALWKKGVTAANKQEEFLCWKFFIEENNAVWINIKRCTKSIADRGTYFTEDFTDEELSILDEINAFIDDCRNDIYNRKLNSLNAKQQIGYIKDNKFIEDVKPFV